MVNVKRVRVSKKERDDLPFSPTFVLGLQIRKLLDKGYSNFIITDEGDHFLIKTWKKPKKEAGK